jgi:DNA-binding transcriptional ArsR family regulator
MDMELFSGKAGARPLDEDELDAAFAALADPTRRAILARLTQGDAGILELAAPFAMSQPAVSKHVAVLEGAGLVSRRREGRTRPCHLEAERLRSLADWVGGYREYWERSFDRLDDLLLDLAASGAGPGPDTGDGPPAPFTTENTSAHTPSHHSPSTTDEQGETP